MDEPISNSSLSFFDSPAITVENEFLFLDSDKVPFSFPLPRPQVMLTPGQIVAVVIVKEFRRVGVTFTEDLSDLAELVLTIDMFKGLEDRDFDAAINEIIYGSFRIYFSERELKVWEELKAHLEKFCRCCGNREIEEDEISVETSLQKITVEEDFHSTDENDETYGRLEDNRATSELSSNSKNDAIDFKTIESELNKLVEICNELDEYELYLDPKIEKELLSEDFNCSNAENSSNFEKLSGMVLPWNSVELPNLCSNTCKTRFARLKDSFPKDVSRRTVSSKDSSSQYSCSTRNRSSSYRRSCLSDAWVTAFSSSVQSERITRLYPFDPGIFIL